jgi:hypothetical protein
MDLDPAGDYADAVLAELQREREKSLPTPAGPYRVGNHSVLNVWHHPDAGSTHGGEQVCMATSGAWAHRIVTALNALTQAVEDGTP